MVRRPSAMECVVVGLILRPFHSWTASLRSGRVHECSEPYDAVTDPFSAVGDGDAEVLGDVDMGDAFVVGQADGFALHRGR